MAPRARGAPRAPRSRGFSAGAIDHFYTTSFAELGRGAAGSRYEGVQRYVAP